MTVNDRSTDCPCIELRFEDAMLSGSGSDWYCKFQDKTDGWDGSLIESPCAHQGGYGSCLVYQANRG
ncbi:MAG: hypothetical protein KKB31_05045 [Nanoarchaeota archaeon]|nr:hypothetical protein [Nanoarchaeota archaeon]